MKKYIVLLIFIFPFMVNAQDSVRKREENPQSEKQLRYGVSINQSITKYGFPSSALFTINFKKHQFDIGPRFGLGYSSISYQRVFGVEFNYRFYPLGDTRWFGPYFLFNASYLNYSTSYIDIYDSSIQNTKNSIEMNLGCGIKFTIIKGFYIGTHVGLGTFNGVKQDITDGEVKVKMSERSGGFIGSVFLGYKF